MNALCVMVDKIIDAIPDEQNEFKLKFEALKQNVKHVYADEYRMWEHVITSKVEQILPKSKNYHQWQLDVLSAFTGETIHNLIDKYGLVLID